ncbi:MAG: thiol reductase thioredoxin [Abitibacteriaceae bacterium]|nr:thiol reductase thioredoxin [Abditibacteriaceae bacterium]MBV9866139.1 thiol reductase thioredoxin [Abditibacteriaceae bacterium]
MEVAAITNNNFDTEVLQSKRPVVIEFWTEGCKPCQALGRAIRQYSDKVKIATCNVDESPELASKYGIGGIPSLLFIKNGEVVDEAVGYMNDISEAEVSAKVEAMLAD